MSCGSRRAIWTSPALLRVRVTPGGVRSIYHWPSTPPDRNTPAWSPNPPNCHKQLVKGELYAHNRCLESPFAWIHGIREVETAAVGFSSLIISAPPSLTFHPRRGGRRGGVLAIREREGRERAGSSSFTCSVVVGRIFSFSSVASFNSGHFAPGSKGSSIEG